MTPLRNSSLNGQPDSSSADTPLRRPSPPASRSQEFRLRLGRSLRPHGRIALVCGLLALAAALAAHFLLRNPALRHGFLLLSLPLALACGLAVLLLAAILDNGIYTAADVTALLGFPPLALLPDPASASATPRSESLRSLAASLADAASARGVRTWIVAGAGEVEVAALVAEAAPALENLGIGVRAVTSSELAATSTPVPGQPAASPFGTASMADRNLRRLRSSADLILVATPPILRSGAAEYLARSADATLLVVESGITTTADLRSAVNRLRSVHAPAVATLLIGVNAAQASGPATVPATGAQPATPAPVKKTAPPPPASRPPRPGSREEDRRPVPPIPAEWAARAVADPVAFPKRRPPAEPPPWLRGNPPTDESSDPSDPPRHRD